MSLALCSDATRARHTWEIIRSELAVAGLDAPTRLEPLLYGASPGDLFALLAELPPGVANLVVVGHEPTMSGTTMMLAGERSDPTALARVSDKFPTGGIAVLRLAGGWADLAADSAVLETFAKPRA